MNKKICEDCIKSNPGSYSNFDGISKMSWGLRECVCWKYDRRRDRFKDFEIGVGAEIPECCDYKLEHLILDQKD